MPVSAKSSKKTKNKEIIEKACKYFLDLLNYEYMKQHMITSKRRDTVIRKKAVIKKLEDLKAELPSLEERLLHDTPPDNAQNEPAAPAENPDTRVGAFTEGGNK